LRFRFAPPAANTGDGGVNALTIHPDHSVGAGQNFGSDPIDTPYGDKQYEDRHHGIVRVWYIYAEKSVQYVWHVLSKLRGICCHNKGL
ncbi:hypothetical protein SAMN06295984_2807, partial [Sphingopyxis terrae subsp. ummariensis]